MAKHFVFSRLSDDLVEDKRQFIRFGGQRGFFLKIGKLKDGGERAIFAFIFDPEEGWTEESAEKHLARSGAGGLSMVKEDLDLPNIRRGEIKKAIA